MRSFVEGARIIDEDVTYISGVKSDPWQKTNIQMIIEHDGKLFLSSLRFMTYAEKDWMTDGKFFLVAGRIPIPEGYQDS